MGFADGLELANNALAFAEHQNVELMAARGNQVISGVGVTPQGSPDLTVAVASGNVLAGGVVVAVSASATFAGTPNTFSTTQGNLTSGQAIFVFIHVDSSGVITNTEGTAAAAGQQLPPDVPEDEVVLAQITLTEGDTTIDTVDIEDWRINVPKGEYIAGSLEITGNLVVGGSTPFQTQDDFLDDLAGLTQATDKIPYMDSATTAALLSFLDEDDLVSDDPLGLASQQSVKAFVDNKWWKVFELNEFEDDGGTDVMSLINVAGASQSFWRNDTVIEDPSDTGFIIQSESITVPTGYTGAIVVVRFENAEANENMEVDVFIEVDGTAGSAIINESINPSTEIEFTSSSRTVAAGNFIRVKIEIRSDSLDAGVLGVGNSRILYCDITLS